MTAEVRTSPSPPRRDEDWVTAISSADGQRELALAELRVILVAGLSRAFRNSTASLVEDSAQEALVRIAASVHTFRGDSHFVSWAMAIATRIVLSEIRRARWRDVSLDAMVEAGQLMPAATHAGSADDQCAQTQLMEIMHKAIQKDLTDKQRDAILAELGGAPPDEVARRLGTNRNAVYKLVYDARARLKMAILGAGWSPDHVRSVLARGMHNG